MNENLAAALVAAQAAMPKVEADATNPHYKTRFVSLDNLIAHTRPVLNKHGLAIVQLPATNDQGLPVLRTMLIHGASGESVTSDAPLMLGKNDMQGLGAAITYARRYAWAAALGISEQEDDDGESARSKTAPVESVSPARKASPETSHSSGEAVKGAAPKPSAAPNFSPPADLATDAQRKKLDVLYGKLTANDEQLKRQFCEAAGGDGTERWAEVRDRLTKGRASALIDHLEKNVAGQT